MPNVKKLWKENRSFVFFIVLMFAFRSAIADWNDVPTGSMQPTIEIGDRIFINKLAYDVRVPFTQQSLKRLADPEQGDIVIFESAVSQNRLVKRVIGVPGDKVAMFNNRLYVNGQPLNYELIEEGDGSTLLVETINGIKHIVQVSHHSLRGNFAEVTVPAEQYLVLGDNRDNSADSRAIGFVPREEIIGKSESVVFSLNYDKFFLPRADRFFSALDQV